MKINAKQIFGIVTTISIVGVVVYSVKKYYDSKKQNEQAIDVEEAKRMVDETKSDVQDAEDEIASGFDLEDIKFGARDQAHYDPSFVRKNNRPISNEQMGEVIDGARDEAERVIAIKPEDLKKFFEEDEEDEVWDETVDPQEIQDSKGYYEADKGVIEDLRYEHNSVEAREQFINMELANLGRSNDARDIISMLYDHAFVPKCDEDQNLKVRLIDHRIKFFGIQSKWSQDVTFGDVIMYYAKAAEYNCGQDALYWADSFLGFSTIDDVMLTSDDIAAKINALNNHNFYNKEMQSYGLFGLTGTQMNEVYSIAHKRIDEQVTYDIEFNVFVQGVI